MPQEMPSVLVSSSVAAGLSANEPWPEDVKLYQPFEAEQIILPEIADCLSVKALLRMCHLDYQVEMRANAESMSPSGRVPFLRCGSFVIAEMEPIVDFLRNKGISLSSDLSLAEKADMKAYMSLVKIVLSNAEMYISWCDDASLREVTQPRFSSCLPWPASRLLALQRKWEVRKRLRAVDWHGKAKADVYEEVNNCCHSLSEKLDTQNFFFGDKPTELDALAFGHLFALSTTPLPDNRLSSIVREYQNLVDLCRRIDVNYFQKTDQEEEDSILEEEH